MVAYYSAEDWLEDGGAGGVGDVHGVELGAERGVGGGIAAAATACAAGGGAELERGVEQHRRPCMYAIHGWAEHWASEEEEEDEEAAQQGWEVRELTRVGA